MSIVWKQRPHVLYIDKHNVGTWYIKFRNHCNNDQLKHRITIFMQLLLIEAEWRIYASVNIPSLVQIMACRLVGAKPLSEPRMECLLTHICVTRPQWVKAANAGILLIQTLGTNSNEILIAIYAFSFKKMHLKMSSGKWRPFVSASVC